jgi:ribosomal protein L29
MLLTGAAPGELPKINVERELQEIEAALADLVEQRRVQLVVEPHLTRGKLQQLLRQGGFHIWHFAGHGGSGDNGKTAALAFEDAQGDLAFVSALELSILLNRSSVRLIVLDACESGRLATEPFRSMAPALIRGQIPAVIAMQFSVPDSSARTFAGEFYRALAEGFPIDGCVTEGRKAVMFAVGLDHADWGIPVVYTRAPDGKLFDLPAAPALPQATGPSQTSPTTNVKTRQTADEELQSEDHQEEIQALKERLRGLRIQKARYGYSADPSITNEIKDLEKEIARLGGKA